MTKQLLVSMIQMAADQACEYINAGDFDSGIEQWQECARLTEQLKLDSEAPIEEHPVINLDNEND